jgi:hypothetical protein
MDVVRHSFLGHRGGPSVVMPECVAATIAISAWYDPIKGEGDLKG